MGKNKPLLERAKNVYWGDGLAPTDCQYKVNCNHMDKRDFKAFLHQLWKWPDCVYYNHNTEERSVTFAFESKLMRDVHAEVLEMIARKDVNLEVLPIKKQ